MKFFRRRLHPQAQFHVALSVLLLLSSSVYARGRKPADGADRIKTEKVEWVRNGHVRKLKTAVIDNKTYFPISSLARLSESQLRLQPVTEQACLSRVDGAMCFNWGRSVVYSNGNPLRKKYHLVYTGKELLVPSSFIKDKSFKDFTQTEISWNSKKKILAQDFPITLHLSPVENLGDRYRVTIAFGGDASYQVIEQREKRLWLRFDRGRFSGSKVLKGDKTIREVQIKQHRRSADLVMRLGGSAGAYSSNYDFDSKQLVIEVLTDRKQSAEGFARAPQPKVRPLAGFAVRKKYKPVTDKQIRTIVIDPGHGGMDSGAIGTRGTFEKDINLKVAKALANRLKKQKNLRVLLTRKRDEFLTLSQRTKVANDAQADLFVSIHCNSSISSKSKGFEVYILSPEATDEAAAAVARIENSVIQLEAEKGQGSSKLEELLASIAVYNFINESSECAGLVCGGVKKKSNVKSTAVKEANFYVLRGAQMPGILVELEYLSNPVTEMKLRSSRYRSKLATGIAEGILNYDRRARQKFQAASAKK